MTKTQEMASYQTAQLAELDKQLALWDQRLSQIDQKIATTTLAVQSNVTQLKGHMATLVAAADAWLAKVALDTEVSKDLQQTVTKTKDKITTLYHALDAPLEQTTVNSISALTTELQALSDDLLKDLSAQAATFATALDQATANLQAHYGVQI